MNSQTALIFSLHPSCALARMTADLTVLAGNIVPGAQGRSERADRCGYVAKISMLRLNIGSGMLRLSSCMLSIGLGPKCEQGKGGQPPPLALNGFGFLANAEHA